eukprot:CAMPEP_0198735362 /NCGR_PEP_ID=MMETSP1475-20131203/58926_1 /TAXON_ID= ORGANISM="Unidentified sp., Strain CCMP1999" /NCGR_SAMPLE_ID=MMETSP1475 /ASSEMBLY_ACC=CAM_ASM_001111 /LENGTH=271 /DNA_ID=CAMNT_0044499013 /DNA_START=248 /DNA_END=1064 /DNA_ORIENTATION=+
MEGGKALILFSALLATASACSCLLQSPQDKYRRERFVYTVFVLAKKAGIPDDSTPFPDVFGDVEFTVQIAGILRPTLDADEYIGATVGLATAAQSAACGVDLRVGEHYVVGGNLRSAPRGGATRSIDLCGTVVPISRDCVVPKCPKKCGLWTDGCRTYRCKNGRVRAVKKKGCKLSDQTARCLKLNFKEPEQCEFVKTSFPRAHRNVANRVGLGRRPVPSAPLRNARRGDAELLPVTCSQDGTYLSRGCALPANATITLCAAAQSIAVAGM